MNKDDLIRMAREASRSENSRLLGCGIDDLERFAALVAAHVRETEFKPDWNKYQQGLADGAAAEREACAKRLDAVGCDHCAANIRARGQA